MAAITEVSHHAWLFPFVLGPDNARTFTLSYFSSQGCRDKKDKRHLEAIGLCPLETCLPGPP